MCLWLADLCRPERIPIVLGHPGAPGSMKAIHGAKANRTGVADLFTDPSVRPNVGSDLGLLTPP